MLTEACDYNYNAIVPEITNFVKTLPINLASLIDNSLVDGDGARGNRIPAELSPHNLACPLGSGGRPSRIT
jgi:hypothetical protein